MTGLLRRFIFISLLMVAFWGCMDSSSGTSCGDGSCSGEEDCASCPDDCGVCDTCGDGTCTGEETCSTCSSDCGQCPRCGDGSCSGEEDCTSCPGDCGVCVVCGDGVCSGSEDCSSCPADCGQCPDGCGDGYCDPAGGENCFNCASDCGQCRGTPCMVHDTPGALGQCVGQVCVNSPDCCSGAWDASCVEAYVQACPDECTPTCGDGVCSDSEDCGSCPSDCGQCPTSCGDGVCSGGEDCRACPSDCSDCSAEDGCAVHRQPGTSSQCLDCVCDADPYCCTVSWDLQCVSECSACGGMCPSPGCGDGVCSPGDLETRYTCPSDCGTSPGCGDGICTSLESRLCLADCQRIPEDCGDGVCGDDEGTWNCSSDCGTGSGDPCESHMGPGCSDMAASWCVCNLDPYCCRISWDWHCVSLATRQCGMACGGPSCGDKNCDIGEDCHTCPSDCGQCPRCGDGECSSGESCSSCPADCGQCTSCGDGVCSVEAGESCTSCPSDCGACFYCGNGVCESDAGEDSMICPSDCHCGDGICAGTENVISCPSDCYCGDSICSPGEDQATCPSDCQGES